ncbi:MAG: nucleoside phosphorylase [Planctomycetaceae bacterium]
MANLPERCDAGIVFALATEADAFAARVEGTSTHTGALDFHEGLLGGRRVAWVVCGPGMGAAGRAADLLLDGHRPRHLVSAGFAGGLDPALARGAAVVAGRSLREGCPALALFAPACPTAVVGGDLVTVDAVVATAAAKHDLRAATGAAIVDMECRAVADRATAAGVPCLSVRVVSDAAGDDLPPDILRLVTPQSALRRAGAALSLLGRRPAAASTLWRLWENAVVDGRTLAAALEATIGLLPAAAGQR